MSAVIPLLADDAPCVFAPVHYVRAWADGRGLGLINNLALLNRHRARQGLPPFVLIGPGASAGL